MFFFCFFKGGDPIEFKKINDAYNKLISHAAKIDAIEAEAELSRTSVIIEISRQAVPKWKEKLKACYGLPKTSKVNNLLFNVSLYPLKKNLVIVTKIPNFNCRAPITSFLERANIRVPLSWSSMKIQKTKCPKFCVAVITTWHGYRSRKCPYIYM